MLTPTTDPVRKLAENARFYNLLAVHAYASYDELEGSEGLRLRSKYRKAMFALAKKTLADARKARARAAL